MVFIEMSIIIMSINVISNRFNLAGVVAWLNFGTFIIIKNDFSPFDLTRSSSLLSRWCSICAQVATTMQSKLTIDQDSYRQLTTREKVAEHRTMKIMTLLSLYAPIIPTVDITQLTLREIRERMSGKCI